MRRSFGLLVFFLLGLGGAAAQPPPGYAPIPPMRYEAVPLSRGERFIWQPGHWHWNGVRYVWFGGRYVDRRPIYRQWVEGRWVWAPYAGRWLWRPAHWD